MTFPSAPAPGDPAGLAFSEDPSVYRTLLESTLAIPWKIDWASMRFAYIGPQIETLLGWAQDSWLTVDDWASRIHDEDRERVVNFCVSQSMAGVDHEADYRALRPDGGYVWIRDVVHVVRDQGGNVEALVGFMFDISERKKAEDEVARLQAELERLSLTDGLTGLSNRRMFDRKLEFEWKSCRRQQQPLSLLMLDIDCFKQFNDAYGHLRGDDCLRAIAEVLAAVALRPRDVVARFGGEEFALLLPDTGAEAAGLMARECAARIASLALPHKTSPVAGIVTASIGVGTGIPPRDEQDGRDFLEAVDRTLYKAKQNGRNRVETLAG